MDTLIFDLLNLIDRHLDGVQTTLIRFDNYDGFDVDDPKWFLYYLRKNKHWIIIRDSNDENVLKAVRDYYYNEGSYEADNINRRLLIMKVGQTKINDIEDYTIKYNEHGIGVGLMNICTLTKALCAAIKNRRIENIKLLKPIFVKHIQLNNSDNPNLCSCYEHVDIPTVIYPHIEAYKTCDDEIIKLFPILYSNSLSIYILVGLAKNPRKYQKEIETIVMGSNVINFDSYSIVGSIARKLLVDQNIQGIKLLRGFFPFDSLVGYVNFIYQNAYNNKWLLSSLFIADDLEILSVLPAEALKMLYIRAMQHKKYWICDEILKQFNLRVDGNNEREYKKKIAKLFTNGVFNEIANKALDILDYKLFKYVVAWKII